METFTSKVIAREEYKTMTLSVLLEVLFIKKTYLFKVTVIPKHTEPLHSMSADSRLRVLTTRRWLLK